MMLYIIFFASLITFVFLFVCIGFWAGLILETKSEIKQIKVKEVSIIDFIIFTRIFKSIDTELKVKEHYDKDTIRGDKIKISYDLINVNGKFYIPITPIQYGLIRLYCKMKARKIYKKLYKKDKEDKLKVNWFKI